MMGYLMEWSLVLILSIFILTMLSISHHSLSYANHSLSSTKRALSLSHEVKCRNEV